MYDPLVVGQRIEPDRLRRALVAVTQDVIRKGRCRDDVVKLRAERGMAGGGAIVR